MELPVVALPLELSQLSARGRHVAVCARRELSGDGRLGAACVIERADGALHPLAVPRSPVWREALTVLMAGSGAVAVAVATAAYIGEMPEDADPFVAAAMSAPATYLTVHLVRTDMAVCDLAAADLYAGPVAPDWATCEPFDVELVESCRAALREPPSGW